MPTWVQDSKTGKLVPKHEWVNQKNNYPEIIIKDFDAFESPASGEIISSKQKYLDDLKRTGSRPYEGFKTEKMEADKHWQYKQQDLNNKVRETVERTMYEIEHGYRNP